MPAWEGPEVEIQVGVAELGVHSWGARWNSVGSLALERSWRINDRTGGTGFGDSQMYHMQMSSGSEGRTDGQAMLASGQCCDSGWLRVQRGPQSWESPGRAALPEFEPQTSASGRVTRRLSRGSSSLSPHLSPNPQLYPASPTPPHRLSED